MDRTWWNSRLGSATKTGIAAFAGAAIASVTGHGHWYVAGAIAGLAAAAFFFAFPNFGRRA
jgi:hypothetical protein